MAAHIGALSTALAAGVVRLAFSALAVGSRRASTARAGRKGLLVTTYLPAPLSNAGK